MKATLELVEKLDNMLSEAPENEALAADEPVIEEAEDGPSRAEEILVRMEAAHRLEHEAAEQEAAEQAARAAAAAALAIALDLNEARADALNTVLRALCRRKGQTVAAFGASDAQTAFSHADDLIHLQSLAPVELDPAFLQDPLPSALLRGAAIERAQREGWS